LPASRHIICSEEIIEIHRNNRNTMKYMEIHRNKVEICEMGNDFGSGK
jgi:hypothetical protein